MPDILFENQCLEIFALLEKQRNEIFARMDTLSDVDKFFLFTVLFEDLSIAKASPFVLT